MSVGGEAENLYLMMQGEVAGSEAGLDGKMIRKHKMWGSSSNWVKKEM